MVPLLAVGYGLSAQFSILPDEIDFHLLLNWSSARGRPTRAFGVRRFDAAFFAPQR